MRVKHRYCLSQVLWCDSLPSASDFGQSQLLDAIRESVRENFGEAGYGCMICTQSFSLKYQNSLTGLFLLRCPRDYCRSMAASLTFVTHIQGRACILSLIHLSGTIRQSQRVLIKHNRRLLLDLMKSKSELNKKNLESLLSVTEEEISQLND